MADAGAHCFFMISFHPLDPSLSGDRRCWWQTTRSIYKPREETQGNSTSPSPIKEKPYKVFITGFKLIPKWNINPVWHLNKLFSPSWRYSVWCSESFICQLKRGKTKVKVCWICVVTWTEMVMQVRMVNTGLQIQIGCKQVSLPGGWHECPHL